MSQSEIIVCKLIKIDQIESFSKIKSIASKDVSDAVISTVRNLNEKTQIEPFIRSSIYDINDTPHGPMEITDILTTKVTLNDSPIYAAFIIKGKSFKAIKAQDVSHQIYRLRKIDGLQLAVFAYTGALLDQPQEEFVSICRDVGCDYSIWDALDLGRLFISEGLLCPRDGSIIEGGICTCGYSTEREELNLFQGEALKALKTSHNLNQRAGLVVLPTGVGKTRIAALDVKSQSAVPVLYLAHTYEILEGASKEFGHHFGREEVNLIKRKADCQTLGKINLATVQLISRNLRSFNRDVFRYLVVDEFHHAAASSYRKIIDYFENDFLLGLTATPFRGDRQDIARLCNDNYVASVELREAVEAGILSPYHYFGCFDDIDYSNIKYKGESYDVKDLEKKLIIPERERAIVEKWREKADGRATIGFCCSQKHALRMSESFKKAGIPADVYLDFTKNREDILSRFKSGRLKVLFTVDVLNEGVDFPFVECLLFLRPTDSKRIFLQQLGRGLRRFPGKTKVIVLDFIGNFVNAYKILEYLDLTDRDHSGANILSNKFRSTKELFNLPLGCELSFDDKVIDVFCRQYLADERNINRFTIARILTQQYLKLCSNLKKRATKAEIDRYCLLNWGIYKILFGQMTKLEKLVASDLDKMGL